MLHFGVTLTPEQASAVFNTLDADGSGVVTPSELAGALFPATASTVQL